MLRGKTKKNEIKKEGEANSDKPLKSKLIAKTRNSINPRLMRNQETWFLTNLMLKDEKKINKKIQSKKNNKKTRIKPDMHKKKKT
jgi:hypothetical protein